MPFRPPPPCITAQQFKDRWDDGARTMEELDPEWAKWDSDIKRQHRFLCLAILSGAIGMALIAWMIAGRKMGWW